MTHLWRRGIGATATAILVSAALLSQSSITSNASWNDAEWVHSASVGTIDCANPAGQFASRGEGRVLSGSLVGLDSASVAEITSVLVTNNGTTATPRPADASSLVSPPLPDACADPLDIDLLDDTIALGLTSVLQLPLNTPTGLIGQFGRARSSGVSAGASGYLTDQGGVNTSGAQAGYPRLATLKLSTLLNSLGYDLGTAVSDTTADVTLGIGAVAGRSALENPCQAIWAGTPQNALQRQYLAAGLDTIITSDLVKAVGTTATGTVSTLNNTANGLVGQQGLLNGLIGPVVGAVGNVLNTLSFLTNTRVKPGATSAAVTSVNLNLAPVNALLSAPIADSNGILAISLVDGTVTIDTAALLGQTYSGADGTTLNGLPPNFNPLANAAMLTTLNSALVNALTGPQGWVTRVNAALTQALDTSTITARIVLPVQKCTNDGLSLCLVGGGIWSDAGQIAVNLSGTVSGLLANNVTISVDLSGLSLGLAGNLVSQLLASLLTALGTLGLGQILGNAVNNVLRPLAQLPAGLVNPVLTLVSSIYTTLYLNGVVAITVNAQSDPSTGSPEPHDWQPLPQGRYDVAALRIGVLDTLQQNGVWLYLGRGAVGATCTLARTAQPGSPCAGY